MLAYEICDPTELESFVQNASPNNRFIYYKGYSLTDTILACQLRKLTYQFALEGKVYLVQKKHGFYFEFIAIKASTPPVIKLVPFNDEQLTERQQRRKHHGHQRPRETSAVVPA